MGYQHDRATSATAPHGAAQSKKVSVLTNGCPENRIDNARMVEFFQANGWIVTADYRDADTIVLNTCGLTQNAEGSSIRAVRRIQATKKASAELIVCGCLPRINMERIREVHDGRIVQGAELEQFCEVVGAKTAPGDIYANYLAPKIRGKWGLSLLRKIASPTSVAKVVTKLYYARRPEVEGLLTPGAFYIKVSTGCQNACAFCAVRLSRGKLCSKPIGQIAHEFDEGLAKGYTAFALIGTDVGSYGRDRGVTLVTLLRELVKRRGDYRIKLRNLQPRFLIEMLPELRDVFRSGRISYLSSALESGNDRILRLMRRGYTAGDFKDAVRSLKDDFPHMQIKTQVMMGFPGESEKEFRDTVRLLDELAFDAVEVYIFEARPGTEAAAMADQVPPKVAGRRFLRLYVRSVLRRYKILAW